MFKVGDTIKFVSVDKFRDSMRGMGLSDSDIKIQSDINGKTDKIKYIDEFNPNIIYTYNYHSRFNCDCFHFARFKKISVVLNLRDKLFEL